jgi:hypothetical protein
MMRQEKALIGAKRTWVSKDEIHKNDDRQSARNDPVKCLDHEGNVFDAARRARPEKQI